jgi:hypothetical protein
MFVNAIEDVGRFTRPIHTITRLYNEDLISPGAATLFFVNEDGVAITCKHVIEVIGNRETINQRYAQFKAGKAAIGKNNKYNQRLKSLEETFQYTTGSLIQVKELFVGVTANSQTSYKWIAHPLYDLAILMFENLDKPLYQAHARFVKDNSSLKQGKFLCRLGFPFPEFTNYHYNVSTDDIEWTAEGRTETPRFPIEGMLTRHIMQHGEIAGLELSTPGLRGQSGGPLFNEQGLICGMQSGTQHLHLGFDMKNLEYNINGRTIRVNNQPFLHVGYCVHADIIKNFLREHQVKFYEE